MQRIEINNLGAIKHFESEIRDFNLYIGEQATGKSTISKCIFFFRLIKESIVEYIFREITEPESIKKKRFPWCMNHHVKNLFVSLFGYSWDLDFDMNLCYRFTNDIYIQIALSKGDGKRKYISINYSPLLLKSVNIFKTEMMSKYTNDSDLNFAFISTERARIYQEIETVINSLFEDDASTYYIPAGRELLTLLSAQKTKIDYEALDLVNRRFMQFIESIQDKFNMGLSKVHQYYPSPNRNFNIQDIAKQIIGNMKGEYVKESDGEYILLGDGDRGKVKLNYASSGQQEILWLLNQLYILMLRQEKSFVIIEEPEAHIYPTLQREVVLFITQFMNLTDSKVLVTTHSPYILAMSNLLYYAGSLEQRNEITKLEGIIDKNHRIHPSKFLAWKLFPNKNALRITNDKENEFDTSLIDEVSGIINKDYTKLYYYEVDNG